MLACNLLTNKNVWSLIMQKYNLCKIITSMLEGTTKATGTAKTQNYLVIYLIYVIQTLPQTPPQSHSHDFPWHCCSATDLWHRKALSKWEHHVCPPQDLCPTASTGHTPHWLWLRPQEWMNTPRSWAGAAVNAEISL